MAIISTAIAKGMIWRIEAIYLKIVGRIKITSPQTWKKLSLQATGIADVNMLYAQEIVAWRLLPQVRDILYSPPKSLQDK